MHQDDVYLRVGVRIDFRNLEALDFGEVDFGALRFVSFVTQKEGEGEGSSTIVLGVERRREVVMQRDRSLYGSGGHVSSHCE